MALTRSTTLEDSKVVTGRTKREMTGQDISVNPLTHKEAIMQANGASKSNTKKGKKKSPKRSK